MQTIFAWDGYGVAFVIHLIGERSQFEHAVHSGVQQQFLSDLRDAFQTVVLYLNLFGVAARCNMEFVFQIVIISQKKKVYVIV